MDLVVTPRLLPIFFAATISTVALSVSADNGGSLTPAEVVSVMASRRVAIRKKCWDEAAQKQDTSLKVDFVVAPNGIVTDANARQLKGSDAIANCVVSEVKRTTFPSSSDGGRFQWPFIFKGP